MAVNRYVQGNQSPSGPALRCRRGLAYGLNRLEQGCCLHCVERKRRRACAPRLKRVDDRKSGEALIPSERQMDMDVGALPSACETDVASRYGRAHPRGLGLGPRGEAALARTRCETAQSGVWDGADPTPARDALAGRAGKAASGGAPFRNSQPSQGWPNRSWLRCLTLREYSLCMYCPCPGTSSQAGAGYSIERE